MQIKYIIYLFLLFSITSCVDEYWPEMDKYENLLVVDGLLTNGDDPGLVKLSISSSINDQGLIPLSDAELYFTDEDQAISQLSESEPGSYIPDSSFFGQVGKMYQLHINLPNGKKYISDPCLLANPSPIDSVYGILEEPNSDHSFPGIQFYIANHNNSNDTSYYFWQLSQTYKYKSSFDIDYTWEGEFVPYPKPDSLRICFITNQVPELLVESTMGFGPAETIQFPLNFVSTETKTLSMKYSLLVKQYTISKSTFDFYDAIDQQNVDQGSLWTQQPYQILGNIHNVNNPDEPVLGYFIVAGVNEKRIFVDRPDLVFFYRECTPDFDLRFIPYEPQVNWPIFIDDIMFLGFAMADNDACFDCRLSGGSLTPPDFWE